MTRLLPLVALVLVAAIAVPTSLGAPTREGTLGCADMNKLHAKYDRGTGLTAVKNAVAFYRILATSGPAAIRADSTIVADALGNLLKGHVSAADGARSHTAGARILTWMRSHCPGVSLPHGS